MTKTMTAAELARCFSENKEAKETLTSEDIAALADDHAGRVRMAGLWNTSSISIQPCRQSTA